MPRAVTYPGVYIEEVPIRSRISRSGTTAAAFVGEFAAGPPAVPIPIEATSELDEVFGPDAASTATGRSLEQFFVNGGHGALVVRTEADQLDDALDALPNHVNLVLVPDTAAMDAASGRDVIGGVQRWAAGKSAIYIIDPPCFGDPGQMVQWTSDVPGRDSNSVVYHPWLAVGNETISPAGAVAGVYVRTDDRRGVWKAPAGTDAVLLGGTQLAETLDQGDIEILARADINAIRSATNGATVWGARTLSSDPEWKYVNVRRLGILIERSIAQGTRWAVFEPNNAELWSTVAQAVESFLAGLWRDGALQGAKAEQAYFVRCGRDTMTAADIDLGRLIIEVGFAPLKPAEFIVISIHQQISSAAKVPGAALANTLALAKSPGPDTGLAMLFTGPVQPAKIAVARGLAEQLGRPLTRISLGQLAARYIGETEKNLARLLNEAAERKSILFFDEADALFGKRAPVRSSHDRHRALSASRLLEQARQFRGIVIFATERAPKSTKVKHVIDFGDGKPPRPRLRGLLE